MSVQYSDREVLEIFVESVEELLHSDFITQVRNGGISSTITWADGRGLVAARTGPRREAIKACLLTLRFFCQNNASTSLCNMEDRVADLPIDAQLKENSRKSRANFNSMLDAPPSIGFPDGAGADTRRDVFNAFLYGIFAHANPKHRRAVKQWQAQPWFVDVEAEFDRVVLEFLRALSSMATVCRKAIPSCVAVA